MQGGKQLEFRLATQPDSQEVQGLLKGRSFPGKVLLSRKTEDTVNSGSHEPTSISGRSDSENDLG